MVSKKAFAAYRQTEISSLDPQQFFPLVRKIAYQIHCKLPSQVLIEDLIQSGYLGLTQALSRFSTDGGAGFETFASIRIRGAILDYLRSEDLLPHQMRHLTKKVEKVIDSFKRKTGQIPSDEMIAAQLNLSIEDVQLARVHADQSHFLSFEDLGFDISETAPSQEFDPSDQVYFKQLLERLSDFISTLNEKEQLVLSLHYEQEMNFKEIALILDLSEPRISQLHAQSIQKIKHHIQHSSD